jgi:hypothetical protein
MAYMEHTAAWGAPFEFQLAPTNMWTAEEWAAPAAGHDDPSEHASVVDIFGSSCSLQPNFVPASSSSSSGGQQQLVEYNYYAAAAQHHEPTGNGVTTTTHEDLSLSEHHRQMESYLKNPMELFVKREDEFFNRYNDKFMKWKMHRYPPSIRALDDDRLYYTVPRVVAIGPYHHYGGDHLMEAEKVKHVAALLCMEGSGLEVQQLYQEVVSAASKLKGKARGLYDDKDVMAGMDYEEEFLPMMFYDACFLVMYMVKKSGTEGDKVLFNFFESNDDDIAHDIMLLENQIPWPLVEAVMNKLCNLERDPLEIKMRFVAHCKDGCLQDRVSPRWPQLDCWDEGYEAPHLLGLLRFYFVGKSSCCGRSSEFEVKKSDSDKIETIPISASAIELAEMGIFLTANDKKNEIPAEVGLKTKCIVFAELPIAPLSLKDLRASMLVNMAALELCTTQNFLVMEDPKREDSAVCSYLLLLCMLMHREEDVHELRTNGILQGAGLTNKNTLDFFTSLQSLRIGRCYADVMVDIEGYRMRRWGWWLWLYKFGYQNRKIILGIVSVVGTLAGIVFGAVKLGN